MKIKLISLIFGLTLISPTFATKLPQVIFKTIQKKEIVSEFNFLGTLRPTNLKKMYAPMDGKINHRPKVSGSLVRKGQILAKIARIGPIQSSKDLLIKAPISGLVSQFYVSGQDHVSKGQILAEIYQDKDYQSYFWANSRLADQLSRGQRVKVKRFQSMAIGRITEISAKISEMTGGRKISIEFVKTNSATQQNFRPGAVVNLTLNANRRKSFVIDRKFILKREGQLIIQTIEKGIVQSLPVKIVSWRKNKFEISGVDADKIDIITHSTQKLLFEGDRVKALKK